MPLMGYVFEVVLAEFSPVIGNQRADKVSWLPFVFK
jgi:hypothetical protein